MSERAEMLRADGLSGFAGISHGFFSRRGGVSGGRYASLNCGYGSDDDRDAVRENRRRALATLGTEAQEVATPYQVHGVAVVAVDAPWAFADRPKADAMVTDRPGVPLGILTADCAPVLFADPENGVVAAAHAGWRGALAGVTTATVAAMAARGARRDRIGAAVGPCIQQHSYEVGPEFPGPFLEQDAGNTAFFRPADRPDHFLFDLSGYVAAGLRALGLARVDVVDRDTCAEANRFFSYRRTCHEGGGDYGRNLSAICLTG